VKVDAEGRGEEQIAGEIFPRFPLRAIRYDRVRPSISQG
jgi:hypothetical protein